MPELPEVEITARRIGEAIAGRTVESALAPGINALRTFDPPLSAIEGATIIGVRRRGKVFMIDFEGDLHMLIHLMSAGRLQLFDTRASLRDRTSRLLLRLDDGRELRLREFGTKQAAWVKLLTADGLADEDTLQTLGPEAYPDPPPLAAAAGRAPAVACAAARSARDRGDRPIVGRRDPARGEAVAVQTRLGARPTRRPSACVMRSSSSSAARSRITRSTSRCRFQTSCRCRCGSTAATASRARGDGTEIEAVFYEDYVMCYCPTCQTDGKVLKDRRLSRLLK